MAKQFLSSPTEPVVQTKLGKIRGYQWDDVYTFHGIKYANAKRFQMPTAITEPWDGVKDALAYGYVCPLLVAHNHQHDSTIPQVLWSESEHCQYLNVWSGDISKGAKKPVMVWIHGGTFVAGSSVECTAYDGTNLAKYGDVVAVSMNHRLNILGFLDMSSFGKKYENSVNAGIADLIVALQWIRDNIESFGGDPDNITLFGHSGGGRKITALMQTPAAAGLFHKAILHSGVLEWNPQSSEHHKKLILLMLKELNLAESDVEKLEIAPYPVLARAYARARRTLYEQDGIQNDFWPVANGWFLGSPPNVAFSDFAVKVPIMLGSTIAEVISAPPMPDKDDYSPEKRREIVYAKYGEYTDELIALFKKAYPNKNEVALLDLDPRYRFNLLNYVERKLDESDPSVPVYVYMFALELDVDGGRGAWHFSDLPFAFHNTDKVPVCYIEGVTEKLENEMNGAWVSFAKTGNPNHSGLPEEWPKYDLNRRAVMVFDRTSGVRFDHEKELVNLHKKAMPPIVRVQREPENLDGDRWVY